MHHDDVVCLVHKIGGARDAVHVRCATCPGLLLAGVGHKPDRHIVSLKADVYDVKREGNTRGINSVIDRRA
jgi:hypothetical protein